MTENDRSILKNLANSREFDSMKRLVEDMVDNWTRQIAIGKTEFEYLRASFERDGKIIGVNALISEISRMI